MNIGGRGKEFLNLRSAWVYSTICVKKQKQKKQTKNTKEKKKREEELFH